MHEHVFQSAIDSQTDGVFFCFYVYLYDFLPLFVLYAEDYSCMAVKILVLKGHSYLEWGRDWDQVIDILALIL